MTQSINNKRIKLISEIESINSETDLDAIKKYIQLLKLIKEHGDIFKGIRKDISIAELKEEQNFTNFDRTEFDKLIAELDIQEPIEELLLMLD